MKPIKYDLGGVHKSRDGWQSVNLGSVNCDIQADILDLDSFCQDGTVDEFALVHTLEHVPIHLYSQFLRDMLRKLKPGGMVMVQQTDAPEIMRMWTRGELSFRAMRCCLFTPADRIKQNRYQQHMNCWGARELIRDFNACGYREVTAVDPNPHAWPFDMWDEFDDLADDQGTLIPNLRVEAVKP